MKLLFTNVHFVRNLFLTLPEVKNHTCSQTKPPQNKNGNQSGAAKKDVTIYKCSLCQKPFLTIQEARNHDCPAQQKTAKKPEQKPKSTQIQSPKPATLQTTPPVSNKPTFNKWAENHGKNSSNVVAAKKPDPPTDDICFVDCGFDDEDANENPKEPKVVEKSQTESQDQVADQSMVFVDVAEPFHDNDTSATAENTQENQDNPEEPSFDQTDINAALSNEFLFDFVDCSDEFIGFDENETTDSQESQKQDEKTVETNHKQIGQYVPSAIKNTPQSKVTVNPYKKLYLTGEVNNSPNPSKKINQTVVEADKRKETNEKPKEPKFVEKSQIDHDDVVFDNQREVDNQILYPVDDEDESGGSIKIGQKMSEKANNQKEVSKLVQKMPEKANSTKETEDDITFKPPKKQIGDTIFTTKNGKISEKEKTTQTNSLTSQKGSGNKSPFSHRYDQVENELEAMFAGIDQKTPEKATIQKKPVASVAKEVLESEQIRQKWEKLHKDRALWWDKQDKERKEKVTLKKCSYCLIELHWRGHYKHEEKCAKKAQPILDQIFGDQLIVDKSGEFENKKPQESGPVLGEFEIGKPTQNQ